jgi:hypothetical protein
MLICTCIILGESILIQIISISYRQKQYSENIEDLKRNIDHLTLLVHVSRAKFPGHYAKLDGKVRKSKRVMQEVSWFSDKLITAFGAGGKQAAGQNYDPSSARSIVLGALQKPQSAEILARCIWDSIKVENCSLKREDLQTAMLNREKEAKELFSALDEKENANLSLEEMSFAIVDWGRQYTSINNSMHDVGQAIEALHSLLFTIVLIVCSLVLGRWQALARF